MSILSKLVISSAAFLVSGLALTSCQSAPEHVQQPDERLFEVVSLEYSEANAMTRSLNGLFADSSVKAHADTRTNSLLLAGSPSEMERARAIVAELDVEVGPGESQAKFEVIQLEHAVADDVRDSLKGLVSRHSSQISIDERTNALLVRADPESMQRIRDLVGQLDRPQ